MNTKQKLKKQKPHKGTEIGNVQINYSKNTPQYKNDGRKTLEVSPRFINFNANISYTTTLHLKVFDNDSTVTESELQLPDYLTLESSSEVLLSIKDLTRPKRESKTSKLNFQRNTSKEEFVNNINAASYTNNYSKSQGNLYCLEYISRLMMMMKKIMINASPF